MTTGLDSIQDIVDSIEGGYAAIYGAIIYLVLSGVDLVEVAGFMALAYIPLLEKIIQNIKAKDGKIIGIDSGFWSMSIGIGLVAIAVGCFKSSPSSL